MMRLNAVPGNIFEEYQELSPNIFYPNSCVTWPLLRLAVFLPSLGEYANKEAQFHNGNPLSE